MRKLFLGLAIGVLCVVGCKNIEEIKSPTEKPVETEKASYTEVAGLVEKLADKTFQVRELATEALQEMILESKDWKSIISQLKKALEETTDPELETRLKHILKPYAEYEKWDYTPGLIKKFPDLAAKLESNDATTRVVMAASLGGAGGKEAVPVLIKLLQDKNEVVRASAAQALGEVANTEAVEYLLKMLKDKSWKVRSYTALSLGMIKDRKAVESLISVLKDENETVRHDTAWALGNIGDSRALNPLVAALGDENSGVRSGAAFALGELKDKQAVKPLIEALKHEDEELRFAAVETLKNITGEDFGEDYDKWLNWHRQEK